MFLIRPQPFLGESLSSWRQRGGLENGFRVYPRPPASHRYCEVDLLPKPNELQWLANEFLLAPEIIHGISLNSVGSTFHGNLSAFSKRRWILPLATTRCVATGGVCCPYCLQEDDVPYFRLSWRFAFVTHCPIHGNLMVERCQLCQAPVWPANLPLLRDTPPADFSACQICRKNFPLGAADDHVAHSVVSTLLECLMKGLVPPSFYQRSTTQEVFGALWCLCQLMLRKNSRHLLKIALGIESDSDEPDSVEGKIESSSISARARLVTAAYQLLTNWPQNFLAAADTANLSRHHFGPTWKQQPIWLAETVEQVLSRRTIGITREKVLSVMHSLELDGKQVSKSSLRRALGVTEARAIDAVVSYRRKATLEEFALLCGEYERQLTVTSSARTQKTSLCRDYLILLLSALSGRKVESVCALTERDVRTLFAALHTEVDAKGDQFKATFQRAEEISGDDALWVRAGASQELRFASRFGRNLAGHSLRARIAKDMRNILPAELWNSADAFRGVFTTY